MRALVVLLLFLSVGLAPAQTLAAGSTDYALAIEQKAFALINDYRTREGLPALAWNDEIAALARAHSRDMATARVAFGHEGFKDRVAHMREQFPYFRGAGENVFFASVPLDLSVAGLAVQSWLHSPHHLKNIRGDFNVSGIGAAVSNDGSIYLTQLFLKTGAAAQ
jgi:uncharacterized protein YkwD